MWNIRTDFLVQQIERGQQPFDGVVEKIVEANVSIDRFGQVGDHELQVFFRFKRRQMVRFDAGESAQADLNAKEEDS